MTLAALAILVVVGCSGDPTEPHSNTYDDWLFLESEPSLTFNREFIYYIRTDTANQWRSGVYRAKVNKPVREPILLRQGLHSPTITSNGTVVAYLDSGRIYYYNIYDSTLRESVVTESFKSIVYINDSLLLAGRIDNVSRFDSLFIINEAAGSVSYFDYGYHPTFIARDTFLCMVETINSEFFLLWRDLSGELSDTLLRFDDLSEFGIPCWPTYEPSQNRIAFVLTQGANYLLYSGQITEVGSHDKEATANMIGTALTEKAYILDYNLIIYTGRDGRFYQINYSGTNTFAFWTDLGPK
jgi:hypothetical protein